MNHFHSHACRALHVISVVCNYKSKVNAAARAKKPGVAEWYVLAVYGLIIQLLKNG